jgi:hypothetical protein
MWKTSSSAPLRFRGIHRQGVNWGGQGKTNQRRSFSPLLGAGRARRSAALFAAQVKSRDLRTVPRIGRSISPLRDSPTDPLQTPACGSRRDRNTSCGESAVSEFENQRGLGVDTSFGSKCDSSLRQFVALKTLGGAVPSRGTLSARERAVSMRSAGADSDRSGGRGQGRRGHIHRDWFSSTSRPSNRLKAVVTQDRLDASSHRATQPRPCFADGSEPTGSNGR